MKAQLISFLLLTTIFVTGCSNSSNLENQDTDSESSSLIFTFLYLCSSFLLS